MYPIRLLKQKSHRRQSVINGHGLCSHQTLVIKTGGLPASHGLPTIVLEEHKKKRLGEPSELHQQVQKASR